MNSNETLKVRIVVLAVVVLALVLVIVLERKGQGRKPVLLAVGEVSKLQLQWKGLTAQLEKTPAAADGAGVWHMTSLGERALLDGRADQGLVTHVVDLLKSLSTARKEGVDYPAEEASAYGMSNPQLVVSLGWQTPSPGEELLMFGNRDVGSHFVFLYFPKRPRLVKSGTALLELLEGKTLADLRDRHLSTFKTDDIEELTTEGPCGRRSLWRNGDHWEWKRGYAPLDTDAWLDRLTGQIYEEELAVDRQVPPGPLWCELVFTGRLNRQETLKVHQMSMGDFAAVSTAFPGVFRVTAGLAARFKAVVRPRAKPSPSPSASPTAETAPTPIPP